MTKSRKYLDMTKNRKCSDFTKNRKYMTLAPSKIWKCSILCNSFKRKSGKEKICHPKHHVQKHSTILLHLNKKSTFHNQQKTHKNISTVNFQENIPGERRVSASWFASNLTGHSPRENMSEIHVWGSSP